MSYVFSSGIHDTDRSNALLTPILQNQNAPVHVPVVAPQRGFELKVVPVEPVANRHRVRPHLRQQRHHLLPRPHHGTWGQQPQLQQVRRGVLPKLDEREERVEPAEQGQKARVVLGGVQSAGVRAGLEALEALVEVSEAGGEGVGTV